jgi:chromobox protein 1
MPPQISDEEASDFGSEVQSAPEPVKVQQEVKVNAEKKGKAKAEVEEPKPAEEESLMVESDKGEEEDEDDQVGEDEYVVEKITNHLVDKATGELKFEVKWEGYDKKSDRTWEPEDNLETASKILNEYLASVGGKEQIFAQHEEMMAEEAAKKSKKRGRASSGVDTPTNGAKKGRKSKSHPLDTTPPASDKGFTPPSGNWEEVVEGIDACEGTDGKPIVYITWKTGQKSQHPLAQVYKRCPQKMLQFYEKHLVFKRNDPEE